MSQQIEPASLMHPLDRVRIIDTKLSDQVYEVLRAAIINGDLLPNARLVEREVAERLHISRTPVREAISRLDQEGYVTALPTRGVVVRSLSPEDVQEIFNLRVVLEEYVVRRAAQRVTRQEIAELERICAESSHCVVLDQPHQVQEFVIMDTMFHDQLEVIANSPRLRRMAASLRPQVLIYRVATLHDQSQRTRSLREHRQIVEALAASDQNAAAKIMRGHLEAARQVVLAWASQPTEDQQDRLSGVEPNPHVRRSC